ncbi:epoxyqueuosine reductase QueH [Candidatus Allofournierella merdipullorum]|uniref:epoxyqueuosine reductase QueH n=1 Tax=Candidatus Allofournierella merdipullorum TaxID=2838595 RepID=UPI003AB75554
MANPPNYAREMEALLDRLAPEGDKKPRLLLHACCGPCSSAVLEQLLAHFEVTILYYNPNIWPAAEYRRRGDELERFAAAFAPAVQVVEGDYDTGRYYEAVAGLEAEPERGGRCTVCYRLRMEEAARYAAEHDFDWFCTTLSISPHKDAARINAIGQELEAQYGVRHLPNDFKKKNGYKRSLELSAEYGLYRQDYCGCEFSARHTAKKEDAPDGPAGTI